MPRLHAILVAAACVVAGCSGSSPDSAAPSSTIATAVSTTTGAPPTSASVPSTSTTTSPSMPSTTSARSLGGYNLTPLRSDGQRVTFRLTVPDGAMGEVSFAPPDTTISLIEASIALVRPDGQSAGGGGIFTAAADDALFSRFCTVTLGGNCAPKTSEPIADGNRVETFTRVDGGTATRVVFGPWAMFVRDRDVANAFLFRSGPDGFPLVAQSTAGYTTKDAYLSVYTGGGPPYHVRSDPSGACSGGAAASAQCDRGLSVEPSGQSAPPSVRRIN